MSVPAKRMPVHAITPARDPLLDEPAFQRVWEKVRDYALAVAGVLCFLVIASAMARIDAGVMLDQAKAENSDLRREIARLNHVLATREASGNCQTLFWLVEGGTPERAAEKLFGVSMQLARHIGEFEASKRAQ